MRYGLVGLITNLLGYSTFLSLTWFGFNPKLVMTLIYFTCTVFSFFGMKNWAFANKQGSDINKTIVRFFMVYSVGYLINLTLLVAFVDHLGYSYQLAQAAAISVIIIYFFITLKLFVFPLQKQLKS